MNARRSVIKTLSDGILGPWLLVMSVSVRLPLLVDAAGHRHERLHLASLDDLPTALHAIYGLVSDTYYLATRHGDIHVRLRLRGGKGGFGSQLRAQGNKMSSKKRAGNYEACRDLSGQRMRSQKQAKLIEEYLEKEPERLSKREQEIREKMQKHLDAPHKKTMFSDTEYMKTTRQLVDNTEDAVRQGLFRAWQEEADDSVTEDDESDSDDAECENGTEDGCASGTDDADDDEKAPLTRVPLTRVTRGMTAKRLDKQIK